VPEEEIKSIESVLTLVDGKIVYGAGEFSDLSPPPIPVLPEWSPVKTFGGYHAGNPVPAEAATPASSLRRARALLHRFSRPRQQQPFWGLGCECFAF
jgi:hypothetical protein